MLFIRSRKPEVDSTRTRECDPLDLPLLCQSEGRVKHAEVSPKSRHRTLWLEDPEAPRNIHYPVDLVLLTYPSQIVYRGRVPWFDMDMVIVNVFLEESGNLSVLVPSDDTFLAEVDQGLGGV